MNKVINLIKIHDFRGIRNLEIPINGKNLLVVGENGTGKSSIVDAIEYFFTFSVNKLSGRADIDIGDCLKYIDSGPLDCHIEIAFSEVDELVRAFFIPTSAKGKLRSPTPVPLMDLFNLAEKRPFILHRAQLTKFIEDRPSDRFKSISNLIGLEQLDSIIEVWKKQRNKCDESRAKDWDSFQAINSDLEKFIKQKIDREQVIIDAINAKISTIGLSNITALYEIPNRRQDLSHLSADPANQKKVVAFHSLNAKFVDFETELTGFDDKYLSLYQSLREYINLSLCVADAEFEAIITDGLKLISEKQMESCPLCEQEIPDPTKLLNRLEQRKQGLQELRAAKTCMENNRGETIKILGRIRQYLNDIQNLLQTLSLDCSPIFQRFSENLERWEENIASAVPPLEPLESWQSNPALLELAREITKFKQIAKDQVVKLTPTEHERSVGETAYFLGQIHEKWNSWSLTRLKFEKANKVFAIFEGLFSKLLQARKTGVQKIVGELEKEFIRLYDQLHPGEGHKAIQIILMEDRTNSADLCAETDGMKAMHPIGNYSEGHLDSLGLCIFLAFIKRFNGDLPLIVLDDVLTSIDSGHRLRVAQLIVREFKDYQIILTTHDELWANELSTIFKNNQLPLKLIRMNPWNRQDGATFDDYIQTDWQYYKERAGKGFKSDAVAASGRSLEKFFLMMRRNLHLAVPATFDDRYTIGELYPIFFDWVEKHPFNRPDISQTSEHLALLREEFNSCWRLRNWSGAHYNTWGETISTNEAVQFISIVEDLVSCFSCPACSSLVIYDLEGKLLRCPACKPSPGLKILWKYDPKWSHQAQRLLTGSISGKSHHLNVVKMTKSATERFLQDARRKFLLNVIATPDDEYGIEHLFLPFSEKVVLTSRSEIADWSSTVQKKIFDLQKFLTVEMRWLDDNVLASQVQDFFDIACDLIQLFSCSKCGSILNITSDHNSFTCQSCLESEKEVLPGAFWYIAK